MDTVQSLNSFRCSDGIHVMFCSGMSKISDKQMAQAEKKIKESEAMIRSMTPQASPAEAPSGSTIALLPVWSMSGSTCLQMAGLVDAGCQCTCMS